MLKKLLLPLLFITTLLNATVPTEENIAKLYLATFNRAPAAAGVNYWVNDSGLSLEGAATSFFVQDEAQRIYPPDSTNADLVTASFQNLFNRTPTAAGLEYWTNDLDTGNISKSTFILALINGAKENDAVILQNKTEVALEYIRIFGEMTNITDQNNQETDPAYLVSIKILSEVTEDLITVGMAHSCFNSAGLLYSPSDPIEHINNCPTAAATLNTNANGIIDYAGEIDYYKIVVANKGELRLSSTGGMDISGLLLDSADTLLTSNNNISDSDKNFLITYNVDPGEYYLAVRADNGEDTGSYSVNVVLLSENNFKVTLKTIEKIAGYEISIKFLDNIPLENDLSIDSGFLSANGRNVSDLGPDINEIEKLISFGAFSFGDGEGVSGEFEVLTFKTKDALDNITIVKSCVDKDANSINCDITISK